MKAHKYIQLENTYGAHNYHPLDVVIVKGKGVWVWDVNGNKYMDFLSAYSALNHGYSHPKLVKALVTQARKLTLTSRAFRNDQLGIFCKELCDLAGFDMMLPMNTGAEAVETSIKMARKWGYATKNIPKNKAEIIVAKNNFHGRTISIVTFSTEDQYKNDFGPFTPGFKTIPFNDVLALKKAINRNTVAVLLEPIQGEGGIIIPDDGYLKAVKTLCNKKNILFMLDEIQTGLGRTGKFFAHEHDRARPDVLILGKALGGGVYPVSAVLSSRDVMSVFTPGDHGSTFGGNPLGSAVSRVALRVLQSERLVKNSQKMGRYLMSNLQTIQSKWIKEIRGKGLFIGIELTKESGGARRFCEALMDEGVLCKETHKYVIRLAPPLIITKKEIDWAFDKIKKVLRTK